MNKFAYILVVSFLLPTMIGAPGISKEAAEDAPDASVRAEMRPMIYNVEEGLEPVGAKTMVHDLAIDRLDHKTAASELQIIKEDPEGRVLFIRLSAADLQLIAEENRIPENEFWVNRYRRYVELFHPNWGRDWRIAAFSEDRYADYRGGEAALRSGEGWFAEYLLFYHRRGNRIIIYPLLPEKRKVIKCGAP